MTSLLDSVSTRELTLSHGTDRGRTIQIRSLLCHRRYEVIDILADGGMGVLFRARDHRVGGNVVLIKAVKYDPGQFGYDRDAALYHIYAMRQRFKREKNVLLEMEARGINNMPNLLDFFYDENPELFAEHPFGRLERQEVLNIGAAAQTLDVAAEPYLVMERIFGRNLRQAIGDLTTAQVLWVARAVCLVLERIHEVRPRERGGDVSFLYMDLKPENLIIDRQGGVFVVDLGAAIPIVEGLRKGKGAYTPGFAAPEVRRMVHPEATIDGRVDIYSLGAILHWALSEEHADPAALATPEDEFPLLDLELLKRDLSPGTRRLVATALARDPAERFADAASMRVAIEDALREL